MREICLARLDKTRPVLVFTRDTARDAQREADRLYREAFQAADRSDLATEQATLLEELRSGARQAAVARLGVLAARGALRRLAADWAPAPMHAMRRCLPGQARMPPMPRC